MDNLDPLASSQSLTRTFPRTLVSALCCAVVLTACERDDSLGSTVKHDAAPDTAAPDTAAPTG
jgi:hypothetical protein